MDDSDRATQLEEFARDAALKNRKPELPITGHCHNCEAAAVGKFCDVDCAADYERVQAAERRANGF